MAAFEQVPGLLSLKHCPNVAFAGVDSPEDITVHTYQELFHTGGFVVSDDKVLETVTPGESRCHPLCVDVQGQFPARFLTSASKNILSSCFNGIFLIVPF